MQDVQDRTVAGNPETDSCWREPEPPPAPTSPPKRASAMTLAEHIVGARDLGEATYAMLRFLETVSDRKHLPVRILDIGLRIEKLIHQIRCEMDHVQYMTLSRPDCLVDCWLGRFNYFDAGEDDGKTTQEART